MECQKHLFSLNDDFHYLNCSYMAPMLKSVEKAGIDGIKKKQTPWSIHTGDFFDPDREIRELFAKIIHAESPNSIALIPSVSYGMAAVAKNIPLNKNSQIVIAGEQFPSNVYPWMKICDKTGATLKIIDPPNEISGRGKIWNEQILEAINDQTALVALANVHWTDGTLFDVKSIGAKAREYGAWLVLDGTQSVGALPFDVREIKPDALICTGYKWLMGPYAMGMAYFGPNLSEGEPVEENWIVRKDSEDFSQLINYKEAYQPGSLRFDVGERSNFILLPMMIAALKQILDWDVDEIQNYCKGLSDEMIGGLPELGFQIEDPKWRAGHLLGIRLPDSLSMNTVKEALQKNHISVSIRGNAIRVSPHVYNDMNDIKALKNLLTGLATK